MIVFLISLVAKLVDVIALLVSSPQAPPLPPALGTTAFYNVRSEQGAQTPNNRLVTNDVRASWGDGDNVGEEQGVEAKPSQEQAQEKKLKVAINKVILSFNFSFTFTY